MGDSAKVYKVRVWAKTGRAVGGGAPEANCTGVVWWQACTQKLARMLRCV
jgi:hypothetical protein